MVFFSGFITGDICILRCSLRAGEIWKRLRISRVGGVFRYLPLPVVDVVDSSLRHLLHHFHTRNSFAGVRFLIGSSIHLEILFVKVEDSL